MNLFTIELLGLIFLLFLGMLMRLLRGVQKDTKIAKIFAKTGTSGFDQIKISLIPIVIWILVSCPYFWDYANFAVAKLASIMVSIFMMMLFFYLYLIAFKKQNEIFNIVIFVLASVLGQFLSYYILTVSPVSIILNILSIVMLIILIIYLLIFIYCPFKFFLFKDIRTKK